MSSAYHGSRVFRVSTSLLLSTSFFVAAIGVWLIQSGKTNISADVLGDKCANVATTATTSSVDFAGYGQENYLATAAPTWKIYQNGTDVSALTEGVLTNPSSQLVNGLTAYKYDYKLGVGLRGLSVSPTPHITTSGTPALGWSTLSHGPATNDNVVLKIPTGSSTVGAFNFTGGISGTVQFALIGANGEMARMQIATNGSSYSLQYKNASGSYQNLPTATMTAPAGSLTDVSFVISWDRSGFSIANGANQPYNDASKVSGVTEIDIIPIYGASVTTHPDTGTAAGLNWTATWDPPSGIRIANAQWPVGTNNPCVGVVINGQSGSVTTQSDTATLSWTSANASTCVGTGALWNNTAIDPSGSLTLGLTTLPVGTPLPFSITCTTASGTSATDTVSITKTGSSGGGGTTTGAPAISYIAAGACAAGKFPGIGDTVVVAGTNFNPNMTLHFAPTGGGTPIVSSGFDGTSGSFTFTVPDNLSVGSYTLSVSNDLGTSAGVSMTVASTKCAGGSTATATEQTVATGEKVICTTAESVAKTEKFDSFNESQAKDFGWEIDATSSTSAKIAAAAGKDGKGLLLTDSNNAAGGSITAWRMMQATKNGSVSFDVRPHQTNGTLSIQLWSADSKPNHRFVWAYLAADGSFSYWYETAAGANGSHFVPVGTKHYTANQWMNFKIEWNEDQKGINLYVDGDKLNSTLLPFGYPNTNTATGAVTWIGIGTYGGLPDTTTGTYDIDNVVYPGCVVASTTGGGDTKTPIDTTKNDVTPSSVASGATVTGTPANKTASLVSAGGNIWVNLAIAAAFSAGVSYFLLRRRHETL